MWRDLELHLGYDKRLNIGQYIHPTRSIQICLDLIQSES
jgi:hypothetical protein